jgi:hypothetical protein
MELLLWLATRISSAAGSEVDPSSTEKATIKGLLLVITRFIRVPFLNFSISFQTVSLRAGVGGMATLGQSGLEIVRRFGSPR